MKLYEISDQYKTLSQLIENNEYEESELLAQLNSITEKFNVKAENIGKFVLSLESDNAGIKTEIDRLTSRKQANDKTIERLKNYVLQEMTVANIETIKGQLLNLSVRTNPPSVVITDIEAIPQLFKKEIPMTWQADKKAIADHFKATGEIPNGVDIITTKKSLSIR